MLCTVSVIVGLNIVGPCAAFILHAWQIEIVTGGINEGLRAVESGSMELLRDMLPPCVLFLVVGGKSVLTPKDRQ